MFDVYFNSDVVRFWSYFCWVKHRLKDEIRGKCLLRSEIETDGALEGHGLFHTWCLCYTLLYTINYS